MNEVRITVYAKPQPQGSSRGFNIGGRIVITSDNKNLKPFRQAVTSAAIDAMRDAGKMPPEYPLFGKHVPVALGATFYFRKPDSVSKKRTHHVVKPDLSKLLRAAEDALTGVFYHDDAQIVSEYIQKAYDGVERTEITVRAI